MNPTLDSDVDTFAQEYLWAHPLLVPSYFALVSIFTLVTFSVFPALRLSPRTFGPEEDVITPAPTSESNTDNRSTRAGFVLAVKDHVKQSGGPTVFLFQIARLILVLILLGLSVLSFLQGEAQRPSSPEVIVSRDLTLCLTYFYASLLALFTIIAQRESASVSSFHLSLLLLVTFFVYAYRDIWPLLTFTLSPADEREGVLLWLKLGVLAFAAVVIPLVIPRQYVPINPRDPQQTLNPEQTAPLLSMMTYTFIDPIVFLANRVPHLSQEMLPPLADYDYTENLVKKSFKHLDTFSGSPRRHIFWGFVAVFGREYVFLAFLTVVEVLLTLMAPVGMNQLLRYLETRGEGAVVRPWVWVAYLFLGPALGAVAFQWYAFIATSNLVRISAIITQLVFEHGLRIRMKAETSDPSLPMITPALTTGARNDATTPDNGSSAEISLVSENAGGNTEMTQGEPSMTTASSITTKEEGDVPEFDSGEDSSKVLVGKMNNLVTSDLDNLVNGKDILMLVLYLPLQVILCVWFLYSILGWSAFVGTVAMVVLFPFPGIIARKIQKVQKETMKRTDARVQTATETMAILRMIKMFGWEPKISARLAEKREQELRYVKIRQILNLVNGSINYVIPVITMIVTFATYTAIMKRVLTPSAVFSSMAVFELIRNQLRNIFWMVPMFTQAKISLDRVNDFLCDTELLDEFADAEDSQHVRQADAPHFDQGVIGFKNASFTWSNDDAADGALTPSRRRFTLRVHDELFFKRGCFNLIIGPTGSGKTSLLMALLGEMHFVPMSPVSWYHLPREGGVSYVAQESWVQNETIRDNILFGTPYDEERYNKVIYQCGLQRDLTLFDSGDKTEVGERGLTLSGGQKARVTLARAVYSLAEIIILDDVLAALDVHTVRWVVEKCFKGDLIHGRTVLLVTHNVAIAYPIADYVVSLGLEGRITNHGSVSDAFTKDKTFAKELAESSHAIKDRKKTDLEEPDKTTARVDGKLILAEESAYGHVSWDALNLFIHELGGTHVFLFWFLFIGGLLLFNALLAVQTWFMGYWAEQYEVYPPEQVSIVFYLTVYGLILLVAMFGYTAGSGVYTFGTLRASKSIHQKLIDSVLGTTLRWLDTTPTSRVIARVTQDIHALDDPISRTFNGLIEITINILIKFATVVFLTPVFVVPGVAIAVLGAWFGQVYMKAQIAIKREMSNAKAPVLGHFGAAVAGLPSIRAYGAQLAFRKESYRRIDRYSRAGRAFYVMNRWISLRIEFLGGLFAAGLAAYMIYVPHELSPSLDTGFSLTMAIGLSGMILVWVRVFNKFGVLGNSLERMHSYINIEQEPKPTKQGIPPAYWPASGDLRVEKLSARYSLDGPKVLHDITFHIKSGERVGVVGRTGSGKSSLTLSLLRCIPTEGSVYYDGILMNSINLDVLRSNITIIPQTPELLSGSLRECLDPFSQYDDATLNGALRASGLFSLQSDEESRLTLDSQIASGGSNLSMGQRQILALARALVRENKLLILDEATSAVDYKTDAIIQTYLRSELKGDVTVITVAHRLQTIIDADKVIVLDAGRLVEFDKPSELLKIEDGKFRSMVDESGDRDLLYTMASKAAETKRGGNTRMMAP